MSMTNSEKKVLVAMSGGVDSAVCAYLLSRLGMNLTGVTMKLWSDSERIFDQRDPLPDENCAEAKKIAELLGFPHLSVALGDTFRRCVVDRFVADYANGLTPNPCVECNRHIKFGSLLSLMDEMGLDLLATGHYAKIQKNADGSLELRRAKDEKKDQSYFLWSIPKERLSRIVFPLGEYTKQEIREIARANGLPNASRSDSQDICFIPDGDYASFLEKHASFCSTPGSFLSADGRILGTHAGQFRYTVGQRKGLGIALGRPIFVKQKDAASNTVVLCDDAELYSNTLTASSCQWFFDVSDVTSCRFEAKIRYRHPPSPATVTLLSENRISVRFDTPQRAITPGQSIVLYDGDTVIGGGIIDQPIESI